MIRGTGLAFRLRKYDPPPWLQSATGMTPAGPLSYRRFQLIENDQDCGRCKHPRSQHEPEDNADENGDSEHEARGACEVRTCFCPRFSSPP